ncbi:MAG: outer membrane protein assembly factor [Desulfuromonas sp.]|nr:MAG: outer membrane protein assembly factor [Desulfuromonas sp.]
MRMIFFCIRLSILFLMLVVTCISQQKSVAAAEASLVLVVSGVEGELRENVEAALAIPRGLVRDGQINHLWLRRYVRQARQKVRDALKPFGYYRAEVDAHLEEGPGQHFLLRALVQPGPPTNLEDVSIELTGPGRDEKVLQQYVKESFPLVEGDVLRHDLYEKGKSQLADAAVDLGYIKAKFTTHIITVDPEIDRARLSLTLDTGPRYRFGRIVFPADSAYPERFLQRYLTFKSGDVFTYAALGRTHSRLIDSDLFQNVAIFPRIETADESRVPIEILLKPKARRTLRPGVGYGTDTGARFSLLYRDINAWQIGHRFDTDLIIAEVRQSIDFSYMFPHYRDIHSSTVIKGGFDREKTDSYISRILFTEAELVQSFGRGKRLSLYARLQRESYEVGLTDETSQLLIPGLRWSQRTYESPTRPLKGYHLGLEIRGTRKNYLSDTSLLQILGEANVLIPLPGRVSVFLRGKGATTRQEDEFEDIPASLRFFTGGDRSVRGFAYQSLGPVDNAGNVVGGKHLLIGGIELERAVAEKWGLAVFYDTGNAFNTLSDYELARAAGIGLHWYTLIGPIKIDVARQLSVTDPSYRLHLSVGFAW